MMMINQVNSSPSLVCTSTQYTTVTRMKSCKVGIWMPDKKWKNMGQEIFDCLQARINKDSSSVVVTRIITEQDMRSSYDIILHKWNDLYHRSESSLTMEHIYIYLKRHPQTVLLDSIDKLPIIIDRHLLHLSLLNEVFPLCYASDPSFDLHIPTCISLTSPQAHPSISIPFPIGKYEAISCSIQHFIGFTNSLQVL